MTEDETEAFVSQLIDLMSYHGLLEVHMQHFANDKEQMEGEVLFPSVLVSSHSHVFYNLHKSIRHDDVPFFGVAMHRERMIN